MQRLSRKAVDGASCRFIKQVRLGAKGRAIFGVADQRMADMGHVHADLMGAAGFQAALHHRGEAGRIRLFMKTFHNLVMGYRLAGIVRVLALDGAFGAVGAAAECGVNGAAQRCAVGPRRRPCRRVPAGRCGRDRQIARRDGGVHCRFSPRP